MNLGSSQAAPPPAFLRAVCVCVDVCVCLTGPEADQFSLSSWPDLARTGGFKAISDLWTAQLPVSEPCAGGVGVECRP
jgi:hypothetical protein